MWIVMVFRMHYSCGMVTHGNVSPDLQERYQMYVLLCVLVWILIGLVTLRDEIVHCDSKYGQMKIGDQMKLVGKVALYGPFARSKVLKDR